MTGVELAVSLATALLPHLTLLGRDVLSRFCCEHGLPIPPDMAAWDEIDKRSETRASER